MSKEEQLADSKRMAWNHVRLLALGGNVSADDLNEAAADYRRAEEKLRAFVLLREKS